MATHVRRMASRLAGCRLHVAQSLLFGAGIACGRKGPLGLSRVARGIVGGKARAAGGGDRMHQQSMRGCHGIPMVAQILVAGARAPGSSAVLRQRLAMLAGALKADPPGLAGNERRAYATPLSPPPPKSAI
jgi:hypothetical protein